MDAADLARPARRPDRPLSRHPLAAPATTTQPQVNCKAMDFPALPGRLARVRETVARHQAVGGWTHPVRIVAVTKTHGPEAVRAALAAGLAGHRRESGAGGAGRSRRRCAGRAGRLAPDRHAAAEQGAPRGGAVHPDPLGGPRRPGRRARPPGARRAAQPVLVQVNCSDEPQKGGVEPEGLPALLEALAGAAPPRGARPHDHECAHRRRRRSSGGRSAGCASCGTPPSAPATGFPSSRWGCPATITVARGGRRHDDPIGDDPVRGARDDRSDDAVRPGAGRRRRGARAERRSCPRSAIILGTGLGGLAEEIAVEARGALRARSPGFPLSTVETHAGKLLLGRLGGRPVVAMQGRFHRYEGYDLQQVTFPVRVLHALGARTLVVSNACGGMNPLWAPGDLVLLERPHQPAGRQPAGRARTTSGSGPGSPTCRRRTIPSSARWPGRSRSSSGSCCGKGSTSRWPGPTSRPGPSTGCSARIGADVVGMSTVPEVIVAGHQGMRTVGISIITDQCLPDALEPAEHRPHHRDREPGGARAHAAHHHRSWSGWPDGVSLLARPHRRPARAAASSRSGRRRACSGGRSRRGAAGRRSCSTRGRRPPTAGRASTTSSPGRSRT